MLFYYIQCDFLLYTFNLLTIKSKSVSILKRTHDIIFIDSIAKLVQNNNCRISNVKEFFV